MKKVTLLFIFTLVNISLFSQKQLTLESAVMDQYTSLYPDRYVDINWMEDQTFSIVDSKTYDKLYIINATKGDTIKTINATSINWPESIQNPMLYGIEWIDGKNFKIVIEQSILSINIDSKKCTTLIANIPENAANKDFNSENNTIAYTVDNNLYIKSTEGKSYSITNFEDKNIVSGQAIHRFEFGIGKGTFWSPTGEKIAYYQKDETKVANYPLLDINETPGKLNNIKYPMAGQPSESGDVFIFDVSTRKSLPIEKQGKSDDYVTNVSWSSNGKFITVAEVNRAQNHMHLNLFDGKTGKFIKTLFEEKNDKWVEPEHPAYFVDEEHFLWLSERDGYMNFYLYNISGKLIKQLTANPWVTKSIIGKNEKGNIIFFSGTGESPLDTKIFALDWKKGKQWVVTTASGTHKAKLNKSGSAILNQHTSINIANQIQLIDIKGKVKNTLFKAKNPLNNIVKPQVKIGTIKAADKKTDLYYRMILPNDFDSTQKYPVLVYVYGGPHAQMVTNNYKYGASLWMYWMANQGYIVYTLDNRGSGSRGFEFESVIHRNLGDNEMLDQLEGVNFLKSLPYVNADKMAIHGWSYGGFMTTSLLLRYPEVFKVGVAGGPVTDWKWYEIMYGERYMDTPEENPLGYEKSSLLNYVKQLEGDLLLIHGTIDDVVVMQHNLALVKAFVEAGIQMDFFPYPMHKHNVRGKDRIHLMTKVLSYIREKLK